MFFDPQSSSQDKFNPSEIEIFSRRQSHPDAEKRTMFSKPEYSLINLETRVFASARRNTADRASCQQSMASFFSLPAIYSSTSVKSGQLISKDSKTSLHFESHGHSTNPFPPVTQQRLSQSVTYPVIHNAGYSAFYKDASSFALSQSEVTSGPFEEENISVSSQDEDKPSPVEIPKIRSSWVILSWKGSLNQISYQLHSRVCFFKKFPLLTKLHCIFGKRFLRCSLNLITVILKVSSLTLLEYGSTK